LRKSRKDDMDNPTIELIIFVATVVITLVIVGHFFGLLEQF
jgi:hypothetical protein